jgi:hypothetical protein
MAGKRRNKAKVRVAPAAPRRKGMEPWKMVVLGVLAIAAAWGAWSWWRYSVGEGQFLALANVGAGRLDAVQKQQGSGGGHLAPGQSAGYRDRMPTSGAHDPKWIDPGVYDTPQLPTRLVHSLEHGMIVIYYDRPPAEVMESLSAWAGLYGAPWSGLVVVPAPGLGDEIVLTARAEAAALRPGRRRRLHRPLSRPRTGAPRAIISPLRSPNRAPIRGRPACRRVGGTRTKPTPRSPSRRSE